MLIGDQDVLTALIGSKEFSEVPVRYLRRGKDIVQCVGPAGYTVRERIRNIGRGLPPLLHGAEPKLWGVSAAGAQRHSIRRHYDRLCRELCPYIWVARQFRDELAGEVNELEVRTVAGRLCRALALGDPTLQGLPLALVHTIGRRIKRRVRGIPWPEPSSAEVPGTDV